MQELCSLKLASFKVACKCLFKYDSDSLCVPNLGTQILNHVHVGRNKSWLKAVKVQTVSICYAHDTVN